MKTAMLFATVLFCLTACTSDIKDIETIPVDNYHVITSKDTEENYIKAIDPQFISDDVAVILAEKENFLYLKKTDMTGIDTQSIGLGNVYADCLFVDKENYKIMMAATMLKTSANPYQYYLMALDYDLNVLWKAELDNRAVCIVLQDDCYFVISYEDKSIFDPEDKNPLPKGDCTVSKFRQDGTLADEYLLTDYYHQFAYSGTDAIIMGGVLTDADTVEGIIMLFDGKHMTRDKYILLGEDTAPIFGDFDDELLLIEINDLQKDIRRMDILNLNTGDIVGTIQTNAILRKYGFDYFDAVHIDKENRSVVAECVFESDDKYARVGVDALFCRFDYSGERKASYGLRLTPDSQRYYRIGAMRKTDSGARILAWRSFDSSDLIVFDVPKDSVLCDMAG